MHACAPLVSPVQAKLSQKAPFSEYRHLWGANVVYGDPTNPATYPEDYFDVVYDNNGKDLKTCKPLIDHFRVRLLLPRRAVLVVGSDICRGVFRRLRFQSVATGGLLAMLPQWAAAVRQEQHNVTGKTRRPPAPGSPWPGIWPPCPWPAPGSQLFHAAAQPEPTRRAACATTCLSGQRGLTRPIQLSRCMWKGTSARRLQVGSCTHTLACGRFSPPEPLPWSLFPRAIASSGWAVGSLHSLPCASAPGHRCNAALLYRRPRGGGAVPR